MPGRFLSYLASVGIIKEVEKDSFVANNVTKNLAQKVSEAGISHWYDAAPRPWRRHGHYAEISPFTASRPSDLSFRPSRPS